MAVERFVLDTSAVLAERPPPVDGDAAISAATLAELHFGVLVARTPDARAERLRRLSVVESTFAALPFDDSVAREYGRLAAAVVAAGRQPRARVMDLVIAATARAHRAALVTANGRDLVGLRELVDVVEL